MKEKKNRMAAIVALSAVFTLAICLIILGAVSIELMHGLSIDGGQFGTLVMSLFLTSCIVQLFIGPLVDKAGYKPVAILGFVFTSLSMFLLAFAQSFSMALVACILLGVGAMSVNTVGNTLIPIVLFEGKDPARASNFGNGFFGLGYTLTPLLVVLITSGLKLDYTAALIIIGVLSLLFLVFVFMADFPEVSPGFRFSKAFRVLSMPVVLIAALALFCYTSLDASMGTWIKKLMEELYVGSSNPNPTGNAGLVLSLFGVTMMAGRFISSAIRNLTAMGPKVITIMAAVSIMAILLMIFAKSPAWGIAGVILAGFSFAPIFPTIIGVTFARSDPALYGSIFGVVFATGLLGGTFVPKIIGNLSVGSTVQQSLVIAAIIAVLLLLIAVFIGRVGSGKQG